MLRSSDLYCSNPAVINIYVVCQDVYESANILILSLFL